MFADLHQRILAFCEAAGINAQDSKTFIQIAAAPPETTIAFTITPAAPYEATIIHRISYGDILSGVFEITAGHRGMTHHTGLLTSDIIGLGAPTWLAVTNTDVFEFSVQNIDVVNRYFECYLWQINVLTRDDLREIRQAILRMTLGGIPAPAPAPPVPTEGGK